MNKQEYYKEFVEFLAQRLTPSDRIKSFVGNHPTLVGDFAEAQVRKFVREIIFPLRVSHGAVIRPESSDSERAKQVDTIIWTPNPLPPLVEVDDFAIVPWTSSMGVLEIKSSAYSDADTSIASLLEMECDLTCGRRPACDRGIPAALGVIVLEREHDGIAHLKEFIEQGKVVVLISQRDTEYKANTEHLLRFINFLGDVRRRALQLGDLRVNPQTKTDYVGDCATASDFVTLDENIELQDPSEGAAFRP
jgi:hypothetical protein